ITTTVGLGSTWLTDRIHEFVDLHPGVNVHLIFDDGELDLGMREADVAIRLRQPVQPDLIQRRLFTVHMHVYGHPSYLATHGRPASIAEVDQHRIVSYGQPIPQYLRDDMVEHDSQLERLIPEADVPSFAAYFVYPAELKNSARVHVFRDFILSKAQ